jgi:hypothetical protein
MGAYAPAMREARRSIKSEWIGTKSGDSSVSKGSSNVTGADWFFRLFRRIRGWEIREQARLRLDRRVSPRAFTFDPPG